MSLHDSPMADQAVFNHKDNFEVADSQGAQTPGGVTPGAPAPRPPRAPRDKRPTSPGRRLPPGGDFEKEAAVCTVREGAGGDGE